MIARAHAISTGETALPDRVGRTVQGNDMSHETFSAYDEAGNRYTIHVRRTFIDARGAGEPRRVEGLRSYHLSDGAAVDRLDAERFAIVASGVSLSLRRWAE